HPFLLYFPSSLPPLHLPSFPTRRSSDLPVRHLSSRRAARHHLFDRPDLQLLLHRRRREQRLLGPRGRERLRADVFVLPARQRLQDRKSTRLNSSHVAISYAVFCLKKKKK